MTEKRVSVRLVAVGGDKLKADFKGIGAAGDQAMAQIGKGAGQMRGQVQNASYQVADFAVQVAGGTSASRALAQQLPQLLGGFGLFGALAGAAAAILIPLGAHMFDFGEESKSAADRLKELNDATGDYERAAAEAVKPIETLIGKYGDLADEVRAVQIAEAELARDRAIRAVDNGVDANGNDGTNPFAIKNADRIKSLRAAARRGSISGSGYSEDQDTRALRGEIEDLADTYDLATAKVEELVLANERLAQANGPAEQALAARAMVSELTEAFGSVQAADVATGGLVSRLLDAAKAAADVAATDMSGAINSAVSSAGALAQQLGISVALASQLMSMGYSGKKDVILDPRDPHYDKTAATAAGFKSEYGTVSPFDPSRIPKVKIGGGKGGGGGGKTPEQKAEEDALREVDRLYKATRTDAEKFAEEQAAINDLFAKGYIDADLHARGLMQLEERYHGLVSAADFWKDTLGDVKDEILDFAVSGEANFDKVADAIKRAALQMLLFGEGPFASMFTGNFGGLLGGFGKLLSFDGGGYTGSGARSGGLDGKGGFPALLHPQEIVFDRTRGQGMPVATQTTVKVEAVPTPYFDLRVAQVSGVGDMRAAQAQQRALPTAIRDMQARGLR